MLDLDFLLFRRGASTYNDPLDYRFVCFDAGNNSVANKIKKGQQDNGNNWEKCHIIVDSRKKNMISYPQQMEIYGNHREGL